MTAPSPQELAATVRAGIARERQQAQAATPGPWRTSGEVGEHVFAEGVGFADDVWVADRLAPDDAAHIAAHDPARVLADCDRAEADLAAWEAVAEQHLFITGCPSECDREHEHMALPTCSWCSARIPGVPRTAFVFWPCPDAQRAQDALARLAATYGGEG